MSKRKNKNMIGPIAHIKVTGEATLEDTDCGTRFGCASGPCISPPEEDYVIADVQIRIDLSQLKDLQCGLEEGFDPDVISSVIEYDKETGTLVVDLTLEGYETVAKRGGIYERLR